MAHILSQHIGAPERAIRRFEPVTLGPNLRIRAWVSTGDAPPALEVASSGANACCLRMWAISDPSGSELRRLDRLSGHSGQLRRDVHWVHQIATSAGDRAVGWALASGRYPDGSVARQSYEAWGLAGGPDGPRMEPFRTRNAQFDVPSAHSASTNDSAVTTRVQYVLNPRSSRPNRSTAAANATRRTRLPELSRLEQLSVG